MKVDVGLGKFYPQRVAGVDPARFADEQFDLFSIPAYDAGAPERLPGSKIGSAKKAVEPGDVLLSRIVPHIRRAWVVPPTNGARQIASGEWIILRGDRICPEYVRYFLLSDRFHSQFMRTVAGVGGSLVRARPDAVARIECPLPPLNEQRRIAAILDKADAIRRKRRQALAEIDALLRAAFLDMFGDPATNPFGFDIQPIEQGLSQERPGTQSGPFGSALKKHEYVRAGIPVWGIDNVQDGRFVQEAGLFISPQKFEQLERYSVQPRDILISRAGTVGRMCIADPPVAQSIISTNLVRVALNEEHLLPEYLCTLFTTFPDRLARLKSNKKENAFTFLNPGTLRAIEIPFPPPDRQLDFRRRVEAIQALRDPLDRDLKDADELFGSLSQRGFRGEL